MPAHTDHVADVHVWYCHSFFVLMYLIQTIFMIMLSVLQTALKQAVLTFDSTQVRAQSSYFIIGEFKPEKIKCLLFTVYWMHLY